MYVLRTLVLILCTSLFALFIGATTKSDPEHVKPDRSERPNGGRSQGPPLPPAVNGADPQATGETILVVAYLDELERARLEQIAVDTYLDALEQSRLAAVAEAARMAASRAPTTQAPVQRGTATGGGDCAAVAAVVGAGTVWNESRGQPLATNGQYLGCAQIGQAWWSGACAGLDWHNTSDQAQCAQIVMNIQGPSAWSGTYGR